MKHFAQICLTAILVFLSLNANAQYANVAGNYSDRDVKSYSKPAKSSGRILSDVGAGFIGGGVVSFVVTMGVTAKNVAEDNSIPGTSDIDKAESGFVTGFIIGGALAAIGTTMCVIGGIKILNERRNAQLSFTGTDYGVGLALKF